MALQRRRNATENLPQRRKDAKVTPKSSLRLGVFAWCFLFLLPFPVGAQQDLARYVNPLIRTAGHGHTFPGAIVPFGMVQLSPDTRLTGWDGSSGYHYS